MGDCKLGAECPLLCGKGTQVHMIEHIIAGIPTQIRCDEVEELFPPRQRLLGRRLLGMVQDKIERGDAIEFMPITTEDRDYRVMGESYADQRYGLHMFGILPCGSKVCVVISDIVPFVDVYLAREMRLDEARDALGSIPGLLTNDIHVYGYEIVRMYPMNRFQLHDDPYLRIRFSMYRARAQFLYNLGQVNSGRLDPRICAYFGDYIRTANDGNGHDALSMDACCRYGFTFGGWNLLTRYRRTNIRLVNGCRYIFEVPVSGVRKIGEKYIANVEDREYSRALSYHGVMVAQWDIETQKDVMDGVVPRGPDKDYRIFMIGTAFYWEHSTEPIVTILISDSPMNIHPGIGVGIICTSEREVVATHLGILGKMRPDVMCAYNGSNFDWPCYRARIEMYGLVANAYECLSMIGLSRYAPPKNGKFLERDDYEQMQYTIGKLFRTNVKVKLDAESTHHMGQMLNVPGILDLDVMMLMLKIYSREEVGLGASLNYFLTKEKMATKEDLSYRELHAIRARSAALTRAPRECHCGRECDVCTEIVREIDCQSTVMHGERMYTDDLHDDIAGRCCYCGKRPRNLADMSRAGYYCVVDCMRPQELCVKRGVFSEHRELARLARVPYSTTFIYAGGSRVRNVFREECIRRGTAYSDNKDGRVDASRYHGDKVTYPGGWVFPPNKGVHDGRMIRAVSYRKYEGRYHTTVDMVRSRPNIGLDFTSLYPSLIMTYNLSPDMFVSTAEEADRLRGLGYTLYHIEPFTYEHKDGVGLAEGWTVRHSGSHTAGMPTISGWETITEGGRTRMRAVRGREPLMRETMGIAATVVRKILAKRLPLKRREGMLRPVLNTATGTVTLEIDGSRREFTVSDLQYYAMLVGAKSKALKVLMNTLYGEMGNHLSPLYEMRIAAGVTGAGRHGIQRAAEYVQELGYRVHYGDTDSVYVSCPDAYFHRADTEYFSGQRIGEQSERELKLRWWRAMVEIAAADAPVILGRVNNFMVQETDTEFLQMSNEGIEFPIIFCCKKKYLMLNHNGKIDFDPRREPMIKGLEMIKRGQAQIVRDICTRYIRIILDPENVLSEREICEQLLRTYHDTDVRLYSVTGKYNPSKANIAIHQFAERMRVRSAQLKAAGDAELGRLCEPPASGDRFNYVMVYHGIDDEVAINGKKINATKGSKMEYVRYYDRMSSMGRALTIDYGYYMTAVASVLARFISYDPMFAQKSVDMLDPEASSRYDKACKDSAKSYLMSVINQRRPDMKVVRKVYKGIYGAVTAAVTDRPLDLVETIESGTRCEEIIDREKNESLSRRLCADMYDDHVSKILKSVNMTRVTRLHQACMRDGAVARITREYQSAAGSALEVARNVGGRLEIAVAKYVVARNDYILRYRGQLGDNVHGWRAPEVELDGIQDIRDLYRDVRVCGEEFTAAVRRVRAVHHAMRTHMGVIEAILRRKIAQDKVDRGAVIDILDESARITEEYIADRYT